MLVALLAVLSIAPAFGQSPRELAEILASDGYYVEPGSEQVDEQKLRDLIQRMRDRGFNFAPVVLATDPSGGAPLLAEAIVDEFGVPITVVVLTPGELGSDSTEFSTTELDSAGLASVDEFSRNVSDGFALFADNLVPGVSVPGAPTSSGGFPWFLVFIVGGLILVVFFAVRKQSKLEKERRIYDIDEARKEIKHQLDEIANVILDESDAMRVADVDEAQKYFEAASKTYADALDLFEKTTTLPQMETISDSLDKARWQLRAAVALRDGEEVPPEPKKERATCFFDPAHEPARETAVLRTSAGEREVKVCPADAERLRRGHQPEPRSINVGGRPMPAPMAPKSYGGGGFGMMDIFEVILGGMASSGGFGGMGRARPKARRHRRYTRSREIPMGGSDRRSRPVIRRRGGSGVPRRRGSGVSRKRLRR